MWNKRGVINKRRWIFVLLAIALILLAIFLQRENLTASSRSNLVTGMSSYTEPKDQGNFVCEEFEENVLWSGGFTHDSKGSTNYQTWIPKNTCNEIGRENCFLQDISINSRTIYSDSGVEDLNRESYVQISALDESECTSPENGVYSTYLAYESIEGDEGVKEGWYCGHDKEETEEPIKSKCSLRQGDKLVDGAECYGIKVYASRSMMIDVFKIRYKLCWERR